MLIVVSDVHSQATESKGEITDISKVLELYAKSSGEKLIVDPRVKGKFHTVGVSLEQLTFDELAAMLVVHNFATYRIEDMLTVVPTSIIKQYDVPFVSEGVDYARSEYVSDMIFFDKACASDLIPVIRPLMGSTSSLTLHQPSQLMHIVDTYSNTVKIRKIVAKVESQLDNKQKCTSS